jgi:hypothetical protein
MAVDHTMPPFGFSTGDDPEYEAPVDDGISHMFKVNVTEAHVKEVNATEAKPGYLAFRYKKQLSGCISSYCSYGDKPELDGANKSAALETKCKCTDSDCWREVYSPLKKAGVYWFGIRGSNCDLVNCQDVNFWGVTAYLAGTNKKKLPFLVTKKTRGWTPTYIDGTEGDMGDPVAKLVLENTTNVYVEMHSKNKGINLRAARVRLVYQKDKIPSPSKPSKETDTLKAFPHPGGSDPEGEWTTGAYQLSAGTWYIGSVVGIQNTDYQLRYGVGDPAAASVTQATCASMLAMFALLQGLSMYL